MRSLLCLIFLLLPPPTVFAELICSRSIYGSPNAAECLQALAAIPFTDQTPRYFIETQLLTSPHNSNWAAFQDPRSAMYQTQSVQLPKYWTYSKIPYSYDGAISSPRLKRRSRKLQYCSDQLRSAVDAFHGSTLIMVCYLLQWRSASTYMPSRQSGWCGYFQWYVS